MRTFVADIIPKIQAFSKKLDELSLLVDQHWVIFDDGGAQKTVYIFRPDKQILISRNGVVEKGHWDYIGGNSLLIETQQKSYLLKHGFFDERILALKIDGAQEYLFLINENKCQREFNSIEDILKFLNDYYLSRHIEKQYGESLGSIKSTRKAEPKELNKVSTPKGEIFFEGHLGYLMGRPVFSDQDRTPLANGKYRVGFMWYIVVEDGVVVKTLLF